MEVGWKVGTATAIVALSTTLGDPSRIGLHSCNRSNERRLTRRRTMPTQLPQTTHHRKAIEFVLALRPFGNRDPQQDRDSEGAPRPRRKARC